MSMTRTTVCLSQEAKHRLTRAARRRHRSEAELIREALDHLLASEPTRPRLTLPIFDDRDPTLGDRVDEVLAEGFGADARPLLAKYAGLNIGLTDAVNVVFADRYGTNLVLTLDERHFRTVRPLTNRHAAFHLLPVDGASR